MKKSSGAKDSLVLGARNGNLVTFATSGFLFASWLSRLPDIKVMLDIGTGTLSFLLLALACGSLVGLPITGRVADRIGTKNTTRLGGIAGIVGFLATSVSISVSQDLVVPIAGLVLVGFGIGMWDVAQNLEGTIIEQKLNKAIMPWFHAAFSGGTVLGALLGSQATRLEVPLLLHLSTAAVLTLLFLLWGTGKFISLEVPRHKDSSGKTIRQKSAWTEPRTLLIGVMVLAAAFTEGAANDWIAVAFVEGHKSTATEGVFGLSAFLLFMTAGRIFGSMALDKFGRVLVLRVLFAATLIGCLLFVFGGPTGAYFGAAIWGLGASLGFPVGMSAASDDPKRAAARISVVSTIGYCAFLAGPPLVGFLGEAVGILMALLAVGAVSALAFVLVPAAKPLSEHPDSVTT
jgi:MFS family permease